MIPNLFIVGQPKSGTTSLHTFLSGHPDVLMSLDKEPCYFCKDFIDESDSFHNEKFFFLYRTEDAYRNLFQNSNDRKICGESTTYYIYSAVAAQEIAKFNPDAKIIIVLRNPVDMLHALHSQYCARAQEDVLDFERALGMEQSRKEGKNIPFNAYFPSMLYYADRVKYALQISRYLKVFPRKNILILSFEEYKMDNAVVFSQILNFLEVSTDYTPDYRLIHSNNTPRFHAINTFLLSSRVKRVVQRTVPRSCYNAIVRFGKFFLWKSEERTELAPELRLRLMHEYASEVYALDKLLGANFASIWGYDKI